MNEVNHSQADSIFLRITYFLIKYTLGSVVRLVWVRKVNGLHNIPKGGPAIIAFNHQSYFDFLCFIAVCPRDIHYLAAEKFFSHIVWNPLMRLTGQIRVNRHENDKRKLHGIVHEHFQAGKLIGIFPEGTRSPHQHEMTYAYTGVTKFAIKAKIPVIPVGIIGTYEVMSRHDHFPRFRKIVTINIGEPIHFHQYHEVKLNRKAHRVLTDHVMLTLCGLSGKSYPHVGKLR